MSKIVVLAEKPSVARDIAKVLHCQQKGNGYFEGKQYIVTWALGHLVTLAEPEAYGEQFKSWRLEDLPMLFSSLKRVVIPKTAKQFHAVKTQLNRKDVSEIVIATDAGREGELVARWILDKSNARKPVKRLWISSVTDKAIQQGFRQLKSGKQYENLYASAVARSEADWYVGMNATRALTCRYNAQLSCGRVQTPTLAMIAHREQQIQQFIPRTYFGLTAITDQQITFVWQDEKTKNIKTFDQDKCDQLLIQLKDERVRVVTIDRAHKKSMSPHLYDLTELQREANKRFNFSARDTLSIMQKLYEQHKVLTYPRTDSRFLTSDIVETLKDRLQACGIGPYSKLVNKIMKQPIKGNKTFINDQLVSDHHAIIPTEQRVDLHAFSDKEQKIYDLVIKRFLAVLHPPFEYEQTTILAKIGDETFIAKGKRVLVIGWKQVYDQATEKDQDPSEADEIKDQTLPQIAKGQVLNMVKLSKTKGETKPPKRFSEGTLLSAMENPSTYMDQKAQQLISTISKAGGIGTVATRADIIEKLFNSFLLEAKGKEIWITSKGKQLLDLVPEELKSPTLTAKWEQKLDAISKGDLPQKTFLLEMKNYAKSVVQEIKNSTKTFKHDNVTGSKCPDCGRPMLEVKSKKGMMLVCQDRECGHRKNLSKTTNARCPNCRKKLELRGEGEGQVFACRCGYKEKMTAFQKRTGKEKSKASKKDVAQYLHKQDKDDQEPFNPALAEALAKLKQQK